MRIKILVVLVSIFFCSSVIAATITSAGSGNWNSTSTWVGGVVPGAGDNVIIANTHNVTANVDITTTGTVTVNSGGTLTLNSGILVNSTINATGAIAWPNGGTIKIGSSANITVSGNISASTTTIEYQNAYVSPSAAKITATGTMAFQTLKSNSSPPKGGSLQATTISIGTYGENEIGVDVYFNGTTTVANYRGYGTTTFTGGTFTVSSSFTANNSGPTNTITSTTHDLIFNVDVVKKGSSLQIDVGNNNVYFNAGFENHWTGDPYSMIVANTVYLTNKIKTEGNAVLYIDANVVQQNNIIVNENASGHIYISGNFNSGAYGTDYQNINGTFFVQGNSTFNNITGHLNSTAQLVTLGNSTMNGTGTWLNKQDGPLYVGGTLTTNSVTTFQGSAKAYVNTVTGGGSVTPSASYTTAPSSVTYNPFPTITGSSTVCVGATITLIGSGTPHPTTPWTSASTSVATVNSSGVVTGVSAGTSIITYRNSSNMQARLTVTVNATPTITGTTPNSRCGTGTVTLGATASAGTINWYTASSGGTSQGTGTSYTTPSISSTTTYYVDATDNGCTTASRTAVIATITAIPVVTVTNGARSGNGTVNLGASTSGGTLSWYDVAVGGSSLGTGTSFTTPSLTNSTTYYVEAVDNGCATREPVQAIVYKIFYSNNADIALPNNWYPNTTASVNIHPNFNDADITLIVQSGHVCPIFSNVTLGSGVILQVDGTIQPLPNVVITGAGIIRGSGTIHVTRTASPADFNTQYVFATKELSNLSFNYSGSGNQIINQLSVSYKHLIVSGSGIKTLENSISIAQTLSFDAAVFIDLNGKTITMQNWANGNIFGHNTDRYIVLNGGKIIAEGVSINEIVQFPIGISTNTIDFCRVDITNITGTHTFTIDGVCEALYSDGTCTGTNGGYVATKKAVDYTWFISSASTNAIVTFYWHTTKELPEFTSSLCAPFHYGSEWELKGVPDEAEVYNTNYRYISGTFTSFSPGSVQNSEGLLPIELSSFVALKKQNGVQLEWVTESEKNNEFFTILRSNNGVNFKPIATVKGSGTSSIINKYSYFDNSIYYGVTYYRLMQTDFDGQQSFSTIVSVEQEQKNFDILSYTQSIGLQCVFELQFADFDSVNTVSIINVLGKVVYEQRFENTSYERIEIELPQGVYTLRNTSFKSSDAKRFIVR